jgi:hypothetical protein
MKLFKNVVLDAPPDMRVDLDKLMINKEGRAYRTTTTTTTHFSRSFSGEDEEGHRQGKLAVDEIQGALPISVIFILTQS